MTEGLSLENYNNTVVITADRNGSTAFIESIKRNNYNSIVEINLGECFSQDYGNPSPKFWNEQIYKPPQVIDAINIGTGKRVIVKCLITWKNFNESYFDIKSKRKIFLYRNMFDSSLSNCLGQKIGTWHNDMSTDTHTISKEFFITVLEYRIKKYNKFLDKILDWTNEIVLYEEYNFKRNIPLRKHPDRKKIVSNYDDLKEIYNEYAHTINTIENDILLAKATL